MHRQVAAAEQSALHLGGGVPHAHAPVAVPCAQEVAVARRQGLRHGWRAPGEDVAPLPDRRLLAALPRCLQSCWFWWVPAVALSSGLYC